jgi:hypothetical protein
MAQRELIGPYQLLKSGQVDLNASTLYRGQVKAADGSSGGSSELRNVWYIIIDTTDKGNADALGPNWSPKLNYAAMGARVAMLQNNSTLIFDNGTVDFSPNRTVTPGDMPNAFPPKMANPRSVSDNNYSPLVRIENAGDLFITHPL